MSTSQEILEQIVVRFDGDTLRQLAAVADARRHAKLTPEGVRRMCEVIESGSKPTLGFYRRHALPPDREPVELAPVEHQPQAG